MNYTMGKSTLQNETSHTCAIVVGVSQYECDMIPNLQFSALDANQFAKLLCEYGIEDIKVLTNSLATRKAILDYIGKTIVMKLNRETGRKRLIVFFSGHGCRRHRSDGIPESILMTYDTGSADMEYTGITLQNLTDVISRSKPDEVFIFIDACSVQFDSLAGIIPELEIEKEVFTNTKAKSVFTYVASAQKAAFEDPVRKSGVFTECLIRNIRNIQESGGNIVDLIHAINSEINCAGKQNPFYYSAGNELTWLFDTSEGRRNITENLPVKLEIFIDRAKAYKSLLEFIVSRQALVFVLGESGIGKSTLMRQVLHREFEGVYVSVSDSGENSLESTVSEIANQMVNLFPNGRPLANIDATLTYYKDNNPNGLIVIDHTERDRGFAQMLYDKFTVFSLRAVMIGREVTVALPEKDVWECPKLSLEEVAAYLEKSGLQVQLTPHEMLRRSNGLPIKLMELVHRQVYGRSDSEDKQRCINSLSATGGFVDEYIFRHVFQLKSATVERLVSCGKIIACQDRFIPHDSIINVNHGVKIDDIFSYWEKQVEKTQTHVWACKQLIVTILTKEDIGCLRKKESGAITFAIRRLSDAREWDILKALTKHLVEKYRKQYAALLLLAKIFVHRSNCVLVQQIMDALQGESLSEEQQYLQATIEAEMSWWKGRYEEAKTICRELLVEPVSRSIEYECRMHIGVADFFLGNWGSALDSLSFAEDIFNTAPSQVNAWALYISATIIGLRGTDIQKGKEWFYAGIRLLEQIGDDSGIASAWGNLAEMNWKLRDYSTAWIQAKRGFDIAKQTDHVIDQIEIARNMLHIRMRQYSPLDQKVGDIKKLIEDLLFDGIGDTVDLQVWNTFATYYAYRGDSANLWAMILKAREHTSNNKEYHIYTLANLCMYYLLEGDMQNSIKYYMEAKDQAMDGSNILAIRQMNDDILFLNKKYPSKVIEEVCSTIKPYVDKVECEIQKQIKERGCYENTN